jgi:NRPS condensation-like uncharacterized protein
MSSNVSSEKLLLVRLMPLFIKKLIISSVYRSLASKRWTGMVTNLGQVSLPEGMEDKVDSFELIPTPPNDKVKVVCALASYKNRMRICFSNITQSGEVERLILRHLSDSGIHVKVLSNK